MPKMKSHRGARKRFSITGSGKVKRLKAFKSHILTKKTSKRKRRLRQSTTIKVRGEVFPAEDPFTKYVGILPLAGPAVISTEGLEWDVKDWETQFGGQVSTSNHVLPDTQVVTVQTDADVLFTIGLNFGGQ